MAQRARRIIVSASRRQDLPGCEPERLLRALSEGELRWRQPFSGQEQRLRFTATDVGALALWSKDFGKLLEPAARAIIDPLRPVFLFTVNDCPELEPGLRPSLAERIAQASEIVRRYGPGRLFWRFDPIVHWIDRQRRARHNAAGFEALAQAMAALGVRTCTFSFAQLYGKVRQRERRLGIQLVDPPLDDKRAMAARLAGYAAELGIAMRACCQPELAGVHPNVSPSRCVDGAAYAAALGVDPNELDLRPHPSRVGCGCTRSIDVGSYAGCRHQCSYCYANPALPPVGAHASDGERPPSSLNTDKHR